jgi:hypothetical protein
MGTEIHVHPFEQNGKCGFRNVVTYETVIPVRYENVQSKDRYSNHKVQLNGKWGIVSSHGDIMRVKISDKYGYVNKSGDIVIPFIYKYADNFSDGKARVCENYKSKAYYIDRNISKSECQEIIEQI